MSCPKKIYSNRICEVMTSTYPLETIDFLFRNNTSFQQGISDGNHKLWNITSFERYIIHMEMLVECGVQDLLTVYMSNMVGVFYEAGSADPSWTPVFNPGFWWSSCCSLFFLIVFLLFNYVSLRSAFML